MNYVNLGASASPANRTVCATRHHRHATISDL